MADKRKDEARRPGRKTTVVRRRRTTGGGEGRIAVRRDTAAYRSAAMDEHSVQVRDQIEAALNEARRMREDIEQRIERRLQSDDEGQAGRILTELTAQARLGDVRPLGFEPRGRGEDTNRSKR